MEVTSCRPSSMRFPAGETCPECREEIPAAEFEPHSSNPKLVTRTVECPCGWKHSKHINIEPKGGDNG